MVTRHRLQDAGGRRRRRILQCRDSRRKRVAMQVTVGCCVERRGDLLALGEYLAAPLGKRHFLRLSGQTQSRLAAA